MKKWLFLLTICLCNLSFASPLQNHKISGPALCELAAALDIPKDADLIEETQKQWLRKSNQERWEMAELSQDKKDFVLNWALQQGIFTTWEPSIQTYDKALIFGATTCRMQKRLDYLKELWEKGIRFSEIVWLTGERPLDKQIDNLTDQCSNEAEAAHILWETTDLPKAMKSLSVSFVVVPMKTDGLSFKRPNTEDTINAWLKEAPEPCKVLFVSDQPFCGSQFAITKAILPEEFQFDVVGKEANPNSHKSAAAITLDSIARWFYQESLEGNRQEIN